jgi:hypothetical protein
MFVHILHFPSVYTCYSRSMTIFPCFFPLPSLLPPPLPPVLLTDKHGADGSPTMTQAENVWQGRGVISSHALWKEGVQEVSAEKAVTGNGMIQ